MPRVAQVLRERGGVATAAVLVEACGRRALARAVAEGSVVRIRRGRYGLPQVDADLRMARALGGALCDVSAAAWWGLDVLRPAADVHVAITVHAMRRSVHRPVRLHFRALTARELSDAMTSVELTVLDCARRLPLDETLAVADSALRMQLTTRRALRAAAAACRGRGSRRARTVVRLADPRAANAFESALRAIAVRAGVTSLVPQVRVETPDGTCWVDLGDRRRRIAVEAESFSFHGSRPQLTRDCRRTNGLVLAGWTVLRFSWEQVMFEPEYVAAVLVAAFSADPSSARVPNARVASA